MENFNVLIVEDDFRVADINKSVTEAVEGFKVVKIAYTAGEAFSFISENSPDLIIVDIYLPDYNGIELIKKIRKHEYPVDIILITAAHDSETVENSMRYGVFDYIIKPFDFSRFKESLENYKSYKSSISSASDYDQNKINVFISHNTFSSVTGDLPKGITTFTLDKIESAVNNIPDLFTIDDIMREINLSKITVRRYLEFLNEIGTLKKTYKHKKIGRPTILYSKKADCV